MPWRHTGRDHGSWKEVICLALIVATKDHPPQVPAEYRRPKNRKTTASLAEMAISNINRHSMPWKVELQRVRHATGNDLSTCRSRLEQDLPVYEIPQEPRRWNRTTVAPPPKKMLLAATTVIVVPPNLLKQWQAEISKHVDAGLLRVLEMDNRKQPLPPATILREYDIILFTRNRFEAEVRDGSDEQGRRLATTQRDCRCTYIGATRIRDCTCLRPEHLYSSPLRDVHFKRLIIDEGHFVSNLDNTAVSVANKLITADARWVVSGTPAKDLLGVEVDMSSEEASAQPTSARNSREVLLQQRKLFSQRDDVNGAIRNLGALAVDFLKMKPWNEKERRLVWDDIVYRHEDTHKRTYSGFSTCLQRVLNSMIVKTQPEDVERDIELPPLTHKIVRLSPSFYDKLTANLFTLVLTANAVTSERSDQDWLFHTRNQKARSQLVRNLMQSAFSWTGFSIADVEASLKSSNAYLSKDGTGCTSEDRTLLTDALKVANTILDSKGWKALSDSHELGIFVEDWPSETAEHWSFTGEQKPLMTGVSQLLEAQRYLNERAGLADPGEGLSGVGIRALMQARNDRPATSNPKNNQKVDADAKDDSLTNSGIPSSSINAAPKFHRRNSISSSTSPKKPKNTIKSAVLRKTAQSKDAVPARSSSSSSTTSTAPSQAPCERCSSWSVFDSASLSASPYSATQLVGTTSAKMSYLISQIWLYHRDEKIIVFYDGDNAAYYIAQMLDLLHISKLT